MCRTELQIWSLLKKKFWVIPFSFFLVLSQSHCGYTLSHRLQGPFRDPRGVFIPVFDNKTDETGAERIFTSSLIREIQSRHQIRLASRESGALELKGVIERIDYTPTAYTAPGYNGLEWYRTVPSQAGVTVDLTLILTDRKTKTVLWAKRFSGFLRTDLPTTRTYDFQAPSSLGVMEQSIIESTYQGVADNIMRDVYDDMVELF
jgi:hypothetical protein